MKIEQQLKELEQRRERGMRLLAAGVLPAEVAQCAELIELLKAGAVAAGFESELWTLPRIGGLIDQRFGLRFAQSSVWRLLQRLGWTCKGRRAVRASATRVAVKRLEAVKRKHT